MSELEKINERLAEIYYQREALYKQITKLNTEENRLYKEKLRLQSEANGATSQPQYSEAALKAVKRHMNPRIFSDPVENSDGSCTIVFYKEKMGDWCEWWEDEHHGLIMGDWLKKYYHLRSVAVRDDRVVVTIEPYTEGETL